MLVFLFILGATIANFISYFVAIGSDFRGDLKRIIFNPTTPNPQSVHFPIINDDCVESDETFSATISTSEMCVNLVGNSATITIQDDDSELYVKCI